VSDAPRGPEHEDAPTAPHSGERFGYDSADEPVTGAPASPPGGFTQAPGPRARNRPTASGQRGWRRLLRLGAPAGADAASRRRRRWFLAAVAVAAAIVVIALCTGALSLVSWFNRTQDRATDARQVRQVRENDCLDLERRLNKLTPPGAASGPKARATAVRDENAAVRIFLGQLHSQQEEDGWRQLLDARTVYADALDKQAANRTPAFYVTPRTNDGIAVSDQLDQWSPVACAGALRRLAAPDL
jgi:hypothetical protein